MYAVDWVKTVLNLVATHWLSADPVLRKAITAACHQIDQQLAVDPFKESESRSGNKRVAFFSPLAVTFHIEEANRRVVISDLRLYRKRPKKK